MYWLMSIDALVRIAVAMGFLFIVIPALAAPARPGTTAVERFFWNFGVGTAVLTLVGQALTLGNLFSVVTLLVVAAAIVLVARSRRRGVGPLSIVRGAAEHAFLAVLNMFDKRVHLRRRLHRLRRRVVARLSERLEAPGARRNVAAWIVLIIVAAAFRLYRPFASANLGFSDTYVHMYLLKLLEEGRQVDPEWGPYPRGLQFVLLAIHKLTNVDEILLMNFFGAVIGVVMTVAVAETARRLSGRMSAAFVAGLLFATLVGGPGQYFIIGGFSAPHPQMTAALQGMTYEQLVDLGGQFDIALTDFQRQTSTLSQELAIALLFPTALFLFGYLRTRDRWHLAGFLGGTVGIAAVHSGVVIPLILMCALAAAITAIRRELVRRAFRIATWSGLAASVAGSAWMLAFVAYPYTAGKNQATDGSSLPTAILYYFPFVQPLANDGRPVIAETVHVMLMPFLILCAVGAIAWGMWSLRQSESFSGRAWIAAVFVLFVIIHFSSRLGIPQLLEPVRNSQWLLMALAVVIGIIVTDAATAVARVRSMETSRATALVVVPLLLLWAPTVPRLTSPAIHEQIVNYSGYGGAALAVLRIGRTHEPYTWTLVSYGQEFPMVLRQGFHIPATTFLDQYDPSSAVVPIPTPHVFVIIEKTPHPFQIDTWAQTFSRTDLEERLQTWIHVYQATHQNLRVFYEDEHVRVYQIARTKTEIDTAMQNEEPR